MAIMGTNGADSLTGTKGSDRIDGRRGNDVLNGGDGADSLLGDAGDDILNGGNGGDRLNGGAGNDILNGGNGDDYLDGGAGIGDDTLRGGAGDDTYSYYTGRGKDRIVDTGGIDTLFISLAESLTVLSPWTTTTLANGTSFRGIEHLDVQVDGTADRVIVMNSGDDFVRFGARHPMGEDASYRDVNESQSVAYSVDLGAGDDNFFSSYSHAAHVIDGGAGLDHAAFDFFHAESGVAVSLAATDSGVPSLIRLTNIESLEVVGGSGDDSFIGGALSDSLFGGGGDDRLEGGDGEDLLVGHAGGDTILGGAGDDEIYGGRRPITNDESGDGPDLLYGDSGNDFIYTTSGDSADGGADIDRLYFASKRDTTFVFTDGAGSIDSDTTVANFEELSWRGGAEKDVVTGGARRDFLEGNDGNDTLKGAGGDDMLADGRGDDHLFGNSGDDILVRGTEFHYRDGSWTGTDVFDGGAGTDTVRFGTFGFYYHYYGHPIGPVDPDTDILDFYLFRDVAGSVTIDLVDQSKNAGLAEGLTLKSVEVIYGAAGEDDLRGADGADALHGHGSDDTLYGRAGKDRLDGGGGSDRLDGGSGNDRLDGGKGNDRLTGGLGADDLRGGTGADVFVFRSIEETTPGKSGRDTILDFRGADRIDLSAIDASTKTKGNQAFTFVGTDAFSKQAGELRYDKGKSGSYIRADVDGDGKSDFAIELDEVRSLTKGDFIL
ncbi:hypothetical protein OCK02_20045 [Rhizobium sp. TRM96647]|uniref:calcium-binding protein n=1 Tax=unclassified Rhizobium TaxID=2613769 RepID=UPI0021E85AAD|nr:MULTISPECIES: calcium-binding protein [unclassified Rhizobium]MCV3738504.1 hypothetical protein [Rhizobium sp. TRM96647]MCV3760191.1 hypothetical protein [Rhizobium sp. TRM96650]